MNSLLLILSKKKYLGPALLFATLNVFFGTWAIYIPAIIKRIGIDEAELGLALLFFGLGTFIMLMAAPVLIKRLKVGKASAYGIFMLGLFFLFPFIADSYGQLCASLFLVGMAGGFTDIAINTLVTEIEKEESVHIMSASHGFFSLGGMLSAGIGTLFLPYVAQPFFHMLTLVVLMTIINSCLVLGYFNISSKKIDPIPFNLKYFLPLGGLIIIGFFIMAAEGAIIDWSALYLKKVSMAKESFIGMGYFSFSFTMALGRFFGDGISVRYGSKKIILLGCITAVVGFGAVLMVRPLFAITGFGLVGLGFSVIVPELFRIGGKMKNINSAEGISLISGSGFLGFLVGPVLLGYLAKISSLRLSMLTLLFFTLISFLTALTLNKK